MSRPTGPTAHTDPPQWWLAQQLGNQQAPQHPPAAHQPATHQPATHQPAAGHPSQGYADPHAAHYAAQQAAPAPAHDPYAHPPAQGIYQQPPAPPPAPHYAHPGGALGGHYGDPHAAYATPTGYQPAAHAAPAPPAYGHDPHAYSGATSWPTAPAPGGPGAPTYDPAYYAPAAPGDVRALTHAPEQHATYGYQQTGGYQPTAGHDQRATDWAHAHHVDQYGRPIPADHTGYATDPHLGYAQQQPPLPPVDGQPPEQDYTFEPEVDEEQSSSRGRRTLVIVGALLGAIAVGMGMMFAYKQFAGGSKQAGRPPIVKNAGAQTKVPADAPGGKKFDTDKQFATKLAEGGATTTAASGIPPVVPPPSASGDSDVTGQKRVHTITVGRDGSMSAPPPPLPTAPAPTSPLPPGMIVEGLTPIAPQPAPRAIAPPTAPPKVVAVAPPPPPPRAAAPAPPTAPAAAPDAMTPPPVIAKKKPIERAAAPAAAGSGYYAVLSSQRSAGDALKAYADIESRYGAVLSGGTPDVREVNVPDKGDGRGGVWYRLLYGPPRSLDGAKEVCAQLKAQGFTGSCWPVKG